MTHFGTPPKVCPYMRIFIQAVLAFLFMLAIPCGASYDNMPTPPPDTRTGTDVKQAEKARVKRGIRWYRSPDRETAVNQMELAGKLEKEERWRKAANAYQALVYAWPDSPEAPKAQLALAQLQEKRQLYARAFDEYQYLFDFYPGQFNYQDVLGRQFKIAHYLMETPKGAFLFFRGFEAPERALPLFEKIIRNGPTWEKAALAQLNIGIIHELNEEEEEAVTAYEIVQNRYSDEALSAQASFREGHCLYKLYLTRPKDENCCNAARAALVQFIRSYPGHEKVTEARSFLLALNNQQELRAFELAQYYDQIANRPKSALIAYEEFLKKYYASTLAPQARERIDVLKKEANRHEKK